MSENLKSMPLVRLISFIVMLMFLFIGLYLFIFAELVATLPTATRGNQLWPWPIGPLAVQFIAAVFIAWAVSALLLALRPDGPTLVANTTVLTIGSAFLLLHSIINWSFLDWSKPLAAIWLVFLIVIFVVNLIVTLVVRRRTALSSPPLPPTPRIALYVDLFIAILTGIVGIAMLFFPQFSIQYWPWDLGNTTNVQLLGALFTGVSLGVLWVWKQPSWYGYDTLYATAGTFALVALVASFTRWDLFAAHPVTKILFVIVYAVGGVLGFYPYFRYALR
jgi:hypothetical protein